MNIFKNLFSLSLFLLIFNTSHAQEDKRIIKQCVTISCCSLWGFSVNLMSSTTCHEVTIYSKNGISSTINSCVMSFKTDNPITEKTITINEDVVLAGIYDEEKNSMYLPRGVYPIINNAIEFTPVSLRQSCCGTICYTVSGHGHLLGISYNFSIRICYTPILLREGTKTSYVITPTLTAEQKALIPSSNHEFILDSDLVVSENGNNIKIEKGIYIINDDGNIYLQNKPLN